MVLAMALFAGRDTMNKLLGSSMAVSQILLFVGFFGSVIFFFLSYPFKVSLFSLSMLNFAFIFRFLCELLSAVLFMVALVFVSLTSASAIHQTTPILVAIGGIIIFKQKVSIQNWILILAGFIGVLLVLQPTNETFNPLILLAVLSTFFLASKDLTTRYLSDSVPIIGICFWSFLALLIGGLICIPFFGDFKVVTVHDVFLLSLSTFFSAAGNFCLVLATRGGKVSVITSYRYSRLPFAILIGVLIFNEYIDTYMLLGCILITVSGVLLGLLKSRKVTE